MKVASTGVTLWHTHRIQPSGDDGDHDNNGGGGGGGGSSGSDGIALVGASSGKG